MSADFSGHRSEGENLRVLAKSLEPLCNVVSHRVAPLWRAYQAKFYVACVGMSINDKCSLSRMN